jgi:hypothetical protein
MERIEPIQVHRMLRQNLGRRSDLGLWNALVARIFEPQNPFEAHSRRRPQRWFVLFVVSSVSALSAFVYFNFWN